MGRVDSRAAIQAAIQNAQIPYVGTVYQARPTIIQEDDYEQTMTGEAIQLSANGSSSVVVVNMPGKDKRMMRAFAGRGNVNDTLIIPVVLELFFASTGGDATAAQVDYDSIVDALFVLIRNNPTLSAPATVWSAGEFTAGVTHTQAEPFSTDDGLTTLIVGNVEFECWQWLSGSGI